MGSIETPISPPALGIPSSSSSTVTVRVIDTSTSLLLNSKLFWQPVLEGFESIYAPVYCFLVSHGSQHVLFDLGVRRDWENYAPSTADLIRKTTEIKTQKNVSEILDSQAETSSEPGIRSKDIDAVIWSHHHFDHVGDPSTFPTSTDLVVGPGVKSLCWPGYPTNPAAGVLDSDAKGRTVREIDFSTPSDRVTKIGRFEAFDYFGDGSFYLLDAPGHSPGHMCALARVTAVDSGHRDDCSFVFMGGDACHHPGLLRPTEYSPLPDKFMKEYPRVCRHATEPFFTLSPTLLSDSGAAADTVRKIHELNAADNVFVILAHDESIRSHIPLYPHTINDWKVRNLGSKTQWMFIEHLARRVG